MSSNIPESLKYTEEHEWIKIDDNVATIGITDFAQNSLGDIVFVELPDVGSEVELGSAFGVVESIKSVSDLYSPLTGEIIEKNESVEESPELINQAAYDSWLIKVKISDLSQVEKLLDDKKYLEHCQNNH